MLLLYTDEKAKRLKKQAEIARGVILALMAASLILCVGACFFVNTRNTEKMFTIILAVSVLSGWTEMILYAFLRRPLKAESMHMMNVLKEEKESFSGDVYVSGRVFSIPKSIDVCALSVKGADGKESAFHLNAKMKKHIPENGTAVRVTVQRGFVTGIEVVK